MNLTGQKIEMEALDFARQHIKKGQIAEAEHRYQDALQAHPEHPEALNFIAMRAVQKGDRVFGLTLLERSKENNPNEPLTLKNLGALYIELGRFSDAESALIKAINLAPDFIEARLELGSLFAILGRRRQAARIYFSAIRMAQTQGKWLSEATTPIGLRHSVKQAINLVNDHRRYVFNRILAPLQKFHGRQSMSRVEQALAGYLGDLKLSYTDPRQRPKFFYMPGLPTHPYLPLDLFPWFAELEAQTAAIQTELAEIMYAGDGIESFLKLQPEVDNGAYLQNKVAQPVWDAFFFYRHGRPHEENMRRCPKTVEALNETPLARIKAHAPEVCFSVLTAGTHIMPHRGVTNTRVVVHLPLNVPPDCALNVGGELHHWQEGRCVVFDDTFEHEAWNRSDRTRVVLILDVWNPYLTSEEREAVNDLVVEIGEFNQEYVFS